MAEKQTNEERPDDNQSTQQSAVDRFSNSRRSFKDHQVSREEAPSFYQGVKLDKKRLVNKMKQLEVAPTCTSKKRKKGSKSPKQSKTTTRGPDAHKVLVLSSIPSNNVVPSNSLLIEEDNHMYDDYCVEASQDCDATRSQIVVRTTTTTSSDFETIMVCSPVIVDQSVHCSPDADLSENSCVMIDSLVTTKRLFNSLTTLKCEQEVVCAAEGEMAFGVVQPFKMHTVHPVFARPTADSPEDKYMPGKQSTADGPLEHRTLTGEGVFPKAFSGSFHCKESPLYTCPLNIPHDDETTPFVEPPPFLSNDRQCLTSAGKTVEADSLSNTGAEING